MNECAKIIDMERLAIEQLIDWKNNKKRKPLILEGARQVGKTWLLKEFGRLYYESVAYINFEERKNIRDLFVHDFDVERILFVLKTITGVDIQPDKTLIILDEIQEAEGGITALKYVAENATDYHVVAAGSYLGIELHKKVSFPVGKVDIMTLYPLSFAEFLLAKGEKNLNEILNSKDWKLISLFHDKLTLLLRQYYYVGGMPEVVKSYVDNGNLGEVRKIQRTIIDSYERDFSKHAPIEIVPRIRQLWQSLPSQLSRENRKFIYGIIKEGARAREYELALSWIKDCGLVYQVNCVKAPRIPLNSYVDLSAFKIYVLDVGLLGAMCELDSELLMIGNKVFTEFKGALTEQFVLQELINKHALYYWAKLNSRQEVDFLVQRKMHIIPVEVKAEENLKAKSLRQFVNENNTELAIRTSMSAYREESWMVNVPLYAISYYLK